MNTPTNNLETYPLNADGELAYHPHRDEPERWVRNDPFTDTMTYGGYERSTSTVLFRWLGTDGRRWTMSMTELDTLLSEGVLNAGTVQGSWRIRKRGLVYGLEWMKDAAE